MNYLTLNTARTIFISLFAMLITAKCIAQTAPSVQWDKCAGSILNDGAFDLIELENKTMLFGGILGYDWYDDGDAFLVNMSLTGNELWSKSYGGSKEDMIHALFQTASGKILFAGSTNSNDGDVTGYHGPGDNRDVWIGITDTNGILLKEHAFGGSMPDYGYSICETPDHGSIFSGVSTSSDGDVTFNHGVYGFNDVWVVKLDSGLNIQWQKSYGGSGNDYGNKIIQLADGNYLITGNTYSTDGDITNWHGANDFWIFKIDTEGNLLWQKSFGGSGFEWANDALENSDGSLMIVGSTTSVDGDVSANYSVYPYEHDIWLIKLDANGNLLWERNFGGTGKDECRSFRKTNDGIYCLSGSTTSTDFDVSDNNGASDFWLIKIDTAGTIIWQQNYGGNKEDESYAVAALSDSSFAIIGRTFSSQSGDVTENCSSGSDSVYSNIWMMKTTAEGLVSGLQESLPLLSSIKILPNPITTSATIQFTLNIASNVSIKLYDVSGREIMTLFDDEMEPEMHSLRFHTSLFPKGIYFVRMIAENGIRNEKLIVQ